MCVQSCRRFFFWAIVKQQQGKTSPCPNDTPPSPRQTSFGPLCQSWSTLTTRAAIIYFGANSGLEGSHRYDLDNFLGRPPPPEGQGRAGAPGTPPSRAAPVPSDLGPHDSSIRRRITPKVCPEDWPPSVDLATGGRRPLRPHRTGGGLGRWVLGRTRRVDAKGVRSRHCHGGRPTGVEGPGSTGGYSFPPFPTPADVSLEIYAHILGSTGDSSTSQSRRQEKKFGTLPSLNQITVRPVHPPSTTLGSGPRTSCTRTRVYDLRFSTDPSFSPTPGREVKGLLLCSVLTT